MNGSQALQTPPTSRHGTLWPKPAGVLLCEDKGDVAITAEVQRFLTSRLYVPELGAAIAEAVRAEADLWKDLTPA